MLKLEKLLALAALLLGMAPFAWLGNTPEALDETLHLRLLLWACVYAGFAFLALCCHGLLGFALREGRLLLALTGLATLSALWSVLPGQTEGASAALWGTTLIGLYMAWRFSPAELLRLLAVALAVMAIGSALTIWLLPDYGVMSGVHEGLWNGLATHKNALGRLMVLGCVCFVWLAAANHGFKRMGAAGLALVCFGLMLGTHSATAYVLLAACGLLYAGLAAGSARPLATRFAMLAMALTVITMALIWLSDATALESALARLGRDPTLTHRTRIWSAAFEAIAERPWLGYGYEAFWPSPLGSSFTLHYTTWAVPHVHNGFIEIWLGLGLGGVILMTLLCVRLLRFCLWPMSGEMRVLYVLALATGLMLNFVEFSFLRYNSIFWLLFIYVLLRLPLCRPASASPARLPD